MKTVAITTLGCKTNQFESAAMIEQFKNAGYEIVSFTQAADIYVINSCTVTARTDSETRRLIRRARRLNAEAKIVATGCYAQVAPGELERLPEVDTVLGNREKLDIARFIETGESHVSDISITPAATEPLRLESFAEHTRAFLQVQNGCNAFCTYCIVPYARGRSRSVRFEDVIEEIRKLAENGYKEVVLTGIHLGAYGADLDPPASLTDLVRRISEASLIQRLRIGSLEPNELNDELIALLSGSHTICRHLHLPLQSGSDTVLKRMGRHYTSGNIRELFKSLSNTLPDAFIGADLIAGFPGESEEEFMDTVRLVNELPFSDLHVFPYSSRPGTKAAEMPGHLNAAVITERAGKLRDLAAAKKASFLKRFAGKELAVLVQKHDPETGICRGLSRNFINVSFPGKREWINCEIKIKTATDWKEWELQGMQV